MKQFSPEAGSTAPPPVDNASSPDAIGLNGVPRFRPLSTQVAINETGTAPSKAPAINQAHGLVDRHTVWTPGGEMATAIKHTEHGRRRHIVAGVFIVVAVAAIAVYVL